MEYEFTLAGRKRTVETDGRAPIAKVVIDGTQYEVDWEMVPGGVVSMLVGGRSYAAHAAERDGGFVVSVRGRSFRIDRSGAGDGPSASARASGGSGVIKAPMPGTVVKVLVSEGDEVAAGDGVVIVEAMKMENEVRSPIDGVVVKVSAAPGDSVGTTEVLVEIEPRGSAQEAD